MATILYEDPEMSRLVHDGRVRDIMQGLFLSKFGSTLVKSGSKAIAATQKRTLEKGYPLFVDSYDTFVERKKAFQLPKQKIRTKKSKAEDEDYDDSLFNIQAIFDAALQEGFFGLLQQNHLMIYFKPFGFQESAFIVPLIGEPLLNKLEDSIQKNNEYIERDLNIELNVPEVGELGGKRPRPALIIEPREIIELSSSPEIFEEQDTEKSGFTDELLTDRQFMKQYEDLKTTYKRVPDKFLAQTAKAIRGTSDRTEVIVQVDPNVTETTIHDTYNIKPKKAISSMYDPIVLE